MFSHFSSQRLESAVRLLVPQLLLVLLLLIGLASLPVPYFGAIKPQLVIMAIYYWAVYRPTLIPPLFCFLLGLTMDIIAGGVLGINAFILVIMQWIVRDQRRFLMGQPYITIWGVFALVIFLCSAAQWLLYSMAHGAWYPPLPAGLSALISFFLFPFVTLLLNLTHRILPEDTRPYP